jgi:PKHD-type hydroxylase
MITEIFPINNLNYEPYVFWEDFFSEQEIDKILSLPIWLESKDANISDNITNPNIRSTKVSWLPVDTSTAWIYNRISTVISEVNNRYFRFDITGLYENIQLGIYDEKNKGHYDWHIDSGMKNNTVSRKLSFAMLLSSPSEFEGGNLQIKAETDIPITVEQKKGRAWIFPAYTLHKVTPVTKGVRRSLVVWAGGPAFK